MLRYIADHTTYAIGRKHSHVGGYTFGTTFVNDNIVMCFIGGLIYDIGVGIVVQPHFPSFETVVLLLIGGIDRVVLENESIVTLVQ